MTLSSGFRLGPYEIVSSIGAGGMGEVYKARDIRLERIVAIKVLPEHLSSDDEVRQRFEREAKTISALSHPHICALHDVGNENGIEYLVMEHLEGETLSDRLAKGDLPLPQVLRFGMEIASALEAAHRRGIVHRDLKPGNVMLTKSGVKLLDFGLAKAFVVEKLGGDPTSTPTRGAELTQVGTILGTLSYMAPEQIEGRRSDARTDIFAFGSVLYEMVTGRKVFPGTSDASVFTAILRDDPAPMSPVASLCPTELDRLIRTCLAKDPGERWQSAHDVGLQLQAISAGTIPPGPAAPVVRSRLLPWLVAAVAMAVAGAAVLRTRGPGQQSLRTIRFSVPAPENSGFTPNYVEVTSLAVSPDGSRLAFVASDPQGGQHIFLRPLSASRAEQVPGTEGANSLFFSPDGRSIAFFAEGKLKRVELSGGGAVAICDLALVGPYWSGSWGGEDILFAGVTRGRGIFRVSAAGGVPTEVIRVNPSRGEARVGWPWFLPGGERFLYLLRYLDGHADLMLGEPGKQPRPVMPVKSAVQYMDPGYLVFASDGVLLAQRFDLETGRISGEPVSITERVRYYHSTGAASFAASRTGTLAYKSEDDVGRLAWFDRSGRELGSVGAHGKYLSVSISPDGRRALFDRARSGIGTYDVWSLDLERGTEAPVTSEPDTEVYPIWLPGGSSIVYSVDRGSAPQLFRKDLATGQEKKLLSEGGFEIAQGVSPDGRFLVYKEGSESGRFDLWILPLAADEKPRALLRAPFNKADVRFSLDGRYLAMISTESGQPEVYVTPYPGPGERIRVSTGGARSLRWSRDGRELLYLSSDRRMISVPVRTTPALEIGTPVALFELKDRRGWATFDVSPDGKRFLAVVPEIIANEMPLSVVVNWTPEGSR